ncbi:hypothetical protein [Bradyrhizobium sp. NP1]|uniref:hypothetical protein n=1 Tax=Bradyrhizobium sp. NP1 TaxID=3049772 RepID=UPI0025A5D049|nr:hypothetical protein [Bradyrhizobium sp. NP1]WJR80802.1 hypothetical protein QOU61_13905 [Bradyrhizobium sp. NP1]
MSRQAIVAMIMVLVCADSGQALAGHARKHRHHRAVVPAYAVEPAPVAPYHGPTLVLHPASNIACDTIYRATRALPCDQPVWVYGSPCEIDLGLGRSRPCE